MQLGNQVRFRNLDLPSYLISLDYPGALEMRVGCPGIRSSTSEIPYCLPCTEVFEVYGLLAGGLCSALDRSSVDPSLETLGDSAGHGLRRIDRNAYHMVR